MNNSFMRRFATLLIFIATITPLSAQSDTSRLTLPQALELTKANYPSIKAGIYNSQSAQQHIDAAKTEHLPALIGFGQVNYGTNNGIAGAYYPNNIPVSSGVRKDNIYQGVFGSFIGFEVNWQAFTFGKIEANVNVAQAEYDKIHAEYDNEVFQQQLKVADAYLLLLVAQKLVDAQQDNLNRAQVFQRVIKARANSGLTSGVDSSFAAAEVSKAQLLLLDSRRTARAYRFRLAELIGLTHSGIEADTMQFFTQAPINIRVDTVGIGQNPLLQVAMKQIEVSRAKANGIAKVYAPSINLVGAVYGKGSGVSNQTGELSSDPLVGLPFQVANYYIGLAARFNILGFLRLEYDYEAENLQTEKFQQLYNEQNLIARQQLDNALGQLELASAQAAEAPVQLAAAQAGYAQANARYQAGLAQISELAQNFYILNRAQIDAAVAINGVWRALLLKAAALGDVQVFLEQVK